MKSSPMYFGKNGVLYSDEHIKDIFAYFNIEDDKAINSSEYFSEPELSDLLIQHGVDEKNTPSYLRDKYVFSIKDIAESLGFDDVTYAELLADERTEGLIWLYSQKKSNVVRLYKSFANKFTEDDKKALLKDLCWYKKEKIEKTLFSEISIGSQTDYSSLFV